MSNKARYIPKLRVVLLIGWVLCNSIWAISQVTPSENSRDIVRTDKVTPTEFAQNRALQKGFRKRVTRKVHTSKAAPEKLTVFDEEVASLGVTIWKLRRSTQDDIYRITDIIGTEGNADMTPERLTGKPIVEEGGLVRLSLEVPTAGYLYVFDREQYGDSSYGAPYLIYPLKGINGLEDNNLVEPTQQVYLPRQKESYCFRFSHGKEKKIVAEVLTILVIPQPLNLAAIECQPTGKQDSKGESVVQCRPREVTQAEFDFAAKLEEWSGHTEIAEVNLKDPHFQAYKVMDKAEIQAVKNKANKLTPQAPPPQQIYTVARKPSEPYMVNIPIYISNN